MMGERKMDMKTYADFKKKKGKKILCLAYRKSVC